MFDSITFRNSNSVVSPIDIGALAESLIFYGKVAIVGNQLTLEYLLKRIPPFVFLSLLRNGRIEFHYASDSLGVSTSSGGARKFHEFVRISSPDHAIGLVAPKAFRKATGGTSQARIGASQFTRSIRLLDHSAFDSQPVIAALSDSAFIENCLATILCTLCPRALPREALKFKLERQSNGFSVDTNIDFDEIKRLTSGSEPLAAVFQSEASVLAQLQGVFEASFLAASLNTELAVTPLERIVHEQSINWVVKRSSKSEDEISSFVRLTLNNGHAIREAINGGRTTFASVVRLLDSADKFRHWLRGQPEEANLAQAYYLEVTKDSWVEKLPTKSVRWSIFTGLGLGVDAIGAGGVGTAAGMALSAFDAFYLDKLLSGWKPNQFIESEFRSTFGVEEGPM